MRMKLRWRIALPDVRARRSPRCMRVALVAAAVLFATASDAASRTRIWIDTDPAIGAPWREVDDAFALVLAFHSPEVEIAGISATYGNAGVRRTSAVARDLVRRFGAAAKLRARDVSAGASSARDLERRSDAAEALANALRRRKLTYVALGPLTNLAACLRLYPELAGQIERVVFVGGRSLEYQLRLGRDGRFRIHDANVFKDPAAARLVLQSSLAITLAPIETSSRLLLEKNEWKALRGTGPSGNFLVRKTGAWMWFWTSIAGQRGGPLFDLLAMLAVAKPALILSETRFAAIDGTGDLLAGRSARSNARPVRFCTKINPGAEELVIRRLCRDSHGL